MNLFNIQLPENKPMWNYKQQREKKKKELYTLELAIREAFEYPPFRELKALNPLVRYIWRNYGDYSAESIARIARKLRVTGKRDTKNNQRDRANLETSYRQYFRSN